MLAPAVPVVPAVAESLAAAVVPMLPLVPAFIVLSDVAVPLFAVSSLFLQPATLTSAAKAVNARSFRLVMLTSVQLKLKAPAGPALEFGKTRTFAGPETRMGANIFFARSAPRISGLWQPCRGGRSAL
jgi:hypothetical protein